MNKENRYLERKRVNKIIMDIAGVAAKLLALFLSDVLGMVVIGFSILENVVLLVAIIIR